MMDIRAHNRIAWDTLADRGDPWTVPVSPQEIEDARQGRWEIVLTPIKPVPREWLDIAGQHVLCLASGGGQQAPILAAAGATVTVLDNAPKQLESDARMAERHGLAISTVLGDMANLHMFADDSFDLVFHPVSNLRVPDVLPVCGQIAAGFSIIGMYEDVDRAGDDNQLSKYMPTFIATRALKSSTP